MGRGANRAGSPAGRAHGRRSVCRSRSPAHQDQPASSIRRPPVLASATKATTLITAHGSRCCGRRRLRCALHPTANDQRRRGDEEPAHADGRCCPRGHAGRRTLRERTRARSPARPIVPGGGVLARQCKDYTTHPHHSTAGDRRALCTAVHDARVLHPPRRHGRTVVRGDVLPSSRRSIR